MRSFFFSGLNLLCDSSELKLGVMVEFWLDDDPRKPGQLKAVEIRARGVI